MQPREYSADTKPIDIKEENKTAFNYELTESDYSIGEPLGSGMRAIIYRGNYKNNSVAIKKASTQESIGSLLQEKTIYEAIAEKRKTDSHDQDAANCIIDYYGYSYSQVLPHCAAEHWIVLVLEYANGGALNRWIFDQTKVFDWSAGGYAVLKDIMNGIYFLHKCNIVHCDIKPDNIVLHQDEQGVHGKLCDFGESKMKCDITSRNTGGTMVYMAPELFVGGHQTESTDIYAAGITIWEMSARKHFFENISVPCLIKTLEDGKREEIPTHCPPKIKHMISWFWQQDPKNRPTAKESRQELKAPIDEISPTLVKFN